MVDVLPEVTATGSRSIPVPVRTGGIALVLSGVLLPLSVLPHPSILGGDVGHTIASSGVWQVLHLAAFACIIAGWWGVVCTVALRRDRLDAWADLALVVSTIGAFVMAAVMFTEAIAFPVIAEHAPELLELDGPVFGSMTFRSVAALGGGYLIGMAMLGVLLVRGNVWPALGRALTVATVAFVVFAGMFVPVLGPASTLVLGVVLVRWGQLLWSAGRP